jgi:hypothetical protein
MLNLKQGTEEYEFGITITQCERVIVRAGNMEAAVKKAEKECQRAIDENPQSSVELWDCYGTTICAAWR